MHDYLVYHSRGNGRNKFELRLTSADGPRPLPATTLTSGPAKDFIVYCDLNDTDTVTVLLEPLNVLAAAMAFATVNTIPTGSIQAFAQAVVPGGFLSVILPTSVGGEVLDAEAAIAGCTPVGVETTIGAITGSVRHWFTRVYRRV